MGHTFKEFKDVSDGKHIIDSIKYAIKWRDIPIRDPIGPVKYDLYERIAASYLETIPAVAQRIDAIEQHLESGGRTPFVRSTELPDVGAETLGSTGSSASARRST